MRSEYFFGLVYEHTEIDRLPYAENVNKAANAAKRAASSPANGASKLKKARSCTFSLIPLSVERLADLLRPQPLRYLSHSNLTSLTSALILCPRPSRLPQLLPLLDPYSLSLNNHHQSPWQLAKVYRTPTLLRKSHDQLNRLRRDRSQPLLQPLPITQPQTIGPTRTLRRMIVRKSSRRVHNHHHHERGPPARRQRRRLRSVAKHILWPEVRWASSRCSMNLADPCRISYRARSTSRRLGHGFGQWIQLRLGLI